MALLRRLNDMSDAMTGMLNTLVDINQIEAGITRTEIVAFAFNDMIERLRKDFACLATKQNVAPRLVPCGLPVRSDPRPLEQMIRDQLSNAMKYTNEGTVVARR
jgi:two-component system CheB/CheR fusion protein